MAELHIRQAADQLGVSVDTVRRRIRRGELPARRDSRGRLLVDMANVAADAQPMQPTHAYAPAADEPSTHRPTDVERQRDQLEGQVRALNEHVAALTRQLDEAAEERRELRQLLAGAMRQLPAGEPASTVPTPERPTVATRADSAAAAADRESAPTRQARRPWWRFWQ